MYVAAPPYSPPRAKPCIARISKIRIGAAIPQVSYLGMQPIRKVASPIMPRVSIEGEFAAGQVAEMPEEDRTERAENETEPKYLANSAKLSLPDGKKCLAKNTASTP